MRSLSRVIAVVTALALVVAASACGAPGFGSSSGKTRVVMWTFLDPDGTDGRGQALAKIIESFERDHPDIDIQVETKPWDKLTPNFLASATAGNAPDIAWTTVDTYPIVLNQDVLVDLNGLAFDEQDVSDFYGGYWDRMTVDGANYGVVMSKNTLGLMYRKDLLDDAGFERRDLETWGGFVRVAGALTDREAGVYGYGQGFSASLSGSQVVVPKMLDAQGRLFTEAGDAAWSTPEAVEALDFEVGLVEDGVSPRDSINWSSEDLYEQFQAGRLAMIPSASTRVADITEELGEDKVGFIRYPSTGQEPAPNEINGWTVGIWNESDVQDAAAKFVAHLGGTESDRIWVEDAGQLPLRKSTLKGLEVPSHITYAAELGANHGWLPPVTLQATDWRVDLNQAAANALVNGQPPEEALDTAQQNYQE